MINIYMALCSDSTLQKRLPHTFCGKLEYDLYVGKYSDIFTLRNNDSVIRFLPENFHTGMNTGVNLRSL